jgi:hypothetical protein
MKIGIIAPERSGKSSYLAGLYGTLVHTNGRRLPGECGLYYEWMDREQKGQMEKQYRTLLQRDIGAARFPTKTVGLHRHRVKVGHKEEPISAEIELVDFPGELLWGENMDKGNPLKARDVDSVLTGCAGFIVLLDANYLRVLDEEEASLLTSAPDIDRVLRDAIRKGTHGSIGVPVALCISKYDCLFSEEREAAHSKAQALFPAFFATSREHPVFVTGITLGEGIENGGKFAPVQIESALEFCLAMCAFKERDTQRAHASREDDREYEARRKERELRNDIEKRKGNLFTAVGRWWTTGKTMNELRVEADSHSSKADRYEAQADGHRSRASEFIRIGEEAAKHFHNVDNNGVIYYKGEVHRFKASIGTGFPLEELAVRSMYDHD